MNLREQLSEALNAYQTEVGHWALHNFGNDGGRNAQDGIVEEVGELFHARLKQRQGIRAISTDPNAVTDKEVDALGDIIVYMLHYCEERHISLATAFHRAWDEVKVRDWVEFPKNGRTE